MALRACHPPTSSPSPASCAPHCPLLLPSYAVVIALICSTWLIQAGTSSSILPYINTDAAIFGDTEFRAEVKPTSDLNLGGGVESATDVYLEHTQALELSTAVESSMRSFVGETTEKATASVTGDYSEEPRTGAPEKPTHPRRATTSSQCLFKIRDQ